MKLRVSSVTSAASTKDEETALYERYVTMANNLPEGWSRNPKSGEKGEAPFVHTSGKVSWKNPNQEKLQAFFKEQEMKRQAMLGNPQVAVVEYKVGNINTASDQVNKHQTRMIKKLRLMLQSGAPLEVVERRAAVENIDMAVVLKQQQQQEEPQNDPSADLNSKKVVVSPVLLKKYIRMRKMGVGLAQVQQLAYVEAQLQPEQLVDLLAMNSDGETKKVNHQVLGVDAPSPGKMDKYRRMKQAGLPLLAIQKTAKMDGVSACALEKGLFGTSLEEVDAVEPTKSVEEIETSTKYSDKYFTVIGLNKIGLESPSDLTALIRKMAHTVDKKSNGTSGTSGVTLTVDITTLYHALGSLQGVQVARDDYNMTCVGRERDNKTHSVAWIKAKRQAFCEMARGVGMKLPSNFHTKVDITGLDELVAFVQKRFQNEIQTVQSLLNDGYYDFDSLAVMYPPGSRVFAGGAGVDMICKVAWNRYQQGKSIMGQPTKYFQVCFEYVVAVGANSATIAEVVEGMESFDGKRSMLGGLLQFIPLTAYSEEQQASMMKRYRRRGNVYNQVALNAGNNQKNFSYKAYQKGSFFVKHGGAAGTLVGGGGNPSAALATGGRIIIDSQGAFDYGHSLNVGYDPMITGIKYKLKEYKLQMRDTDQNKKQTPNGGGSNEDDSGLVLFHQIPEDFLEFVWPCVVGFSLSAKAWGDCLVDGLEDIIFSEDVFDRLVLPDTRKRLVKALVKHSAGINGNGFQDLISGKGEGTVFLLYGPPGVGKTLTAEAVAEVLERPLFSVSMGTLGTTADELEKRLGEILKLSAKWDAIILLDEADSFLETRSSTSSLERNAMVSVMLKLVEYFSGILFLTSNRFDSLDPAFQTRITLSLAYENLDAAGRKRVWDNLLSKSGISTSGFNMDELAQFPLNGREIKNALRLALALAVEENSDLTQNMLMYTAAMIKPVDKEVGGKKRNQCLSLFQWCK
ncbi:phospholipid-translocating P-type ATPase, flippase [Nitzschia inconspicua]|uniref:Phospholipid-translocating P-type ATPase, flippase n=1 Tax=Nitzschia inconspicua TaxID=303405 RepID=A0A9K3M395_9STRA|nr:phospholipid-translocating P-type ATPase, flippase [Nitzschia inconspicua]